EEQLGGDLRGPFFKEDVDTPHSVSLKVVEAESVGGMKDQWNPRQLRGPAAEDSGFRTVSVNNLRSLRAKEPPQPEEGDRVLKRANLAHEPWIPHTFESWNPIRPVHE